VDFIVFIFGLVVGSFLNVCIYRIPIGESIVTPRSKCPSCGSKISFYDNVPILSYILLRGKCRHCGTNISLQYPAVELLNAILWLLIYHRFGLNSSSLFYCFFSSAMIVLAFVDAHHRILPHSITVGGLVIAVATAPLQNLNIADGQNLSGLFAKMDIYFSHPSAWAWVNSLLGLMVGGGMLLSVAVGYYLLKKKEGMGHGDIIMMAFIGAVLGWLRTFLVVFLGSFVGAVVGIALIKKTGSDSSYEIPFGTFLSIASVVVLLWGDYILNWYWSLT